MNGGRCPSESIPTWQPQLCSDGERSLSGSSRGTSGIGLVGLGRLKFEDVAGLAIEMKTDRFERGKADRFGFPGLEHGEILGSDSNGLGEIVELHLAAGKHDIEVDDDGHDRWVVGELVLAE